MTKDFGKLNTYEVIQKGSKVAVIGLGAFYSLGEKAAELINHAKKPFVFVGGGAVISDAARELKESLIRCRHLWVTALWEKAPLTVQMNATAACWGCMGPRLLTWV